MKLHKKLATISLIGIAICGVAAQADEMVTNADFSGYQYDSNNNLTIPGWTLAGDYVASSVGSNSDLSGNPFMTGNSFIAATSGQGLGQGSLSKILSLAAGNTYDVKFDLSDALTSLYSTGDFFQAAIGAQTLLILTPPGDNTPLPQQSFDYQYIATDANTLLTFSFINENKFFYLSNVSVTSSNVPVTPVPLPSAFTLMLTAGLLLVGNRVRHKPRLA